MLTRVTSLVLVIGLGTILLTSIALPRVRSAELEEMAGAGRGSARSSAAQAGAHSVRQLPIITKDVVFDRTTGKLYASVPSSAGATGNSIARINPTTGQVEGFVFIGSEPGKLALSDDGHTLFASLDGAAAVRRYDIATQTPGGQFALGEDLSTGPYFVKDLAVAPGNPDLLAISRRNLSSSPDFEGVAVYDGGVRRSLTTPRHTGSDFIAFSASAATLYGFGFGAGLQKMSVSPSGVTVVASKPDCGFGH